MNRRELLTAAIGSLSLQGTPLPKAAPSTSRRPWAKRADDLEEKHGVWADFEAFDEWWLEQVKIHERSCDLAVNGFSEQVALYSIMCDLCDNPDLCDLT